MPAYSFSLIQCLKIKRTLETCAEFINTKHQLMAEIQNASQNIPAAYIEDLYGTILARVI